MREEKEAARIDPWQSDDDEEEANEAVEEEQRDPLRGQRVHAWVCESVSLTPRGIDWEIVTSSSPMPAPVGTSRVSSLRPGTNGRCFPVTLDIPSTCLGGGVLVCFRGTYVSRRGKIDNAPPPSLSPPLRRISYRACDHKGLGQ